MGEKQDYIASLQSAILRLEACGSIHRATVPVHEQWKGITVWKGDVEVFDLMQHPKAKRAYAWADWADLSRPKDQENRFVVVLDLCALRVKDAKTAVRASIFPALSFQVRTLPAKQRRR